MAVSPRSDRAGPFWLVMGSNGVHRIGASGPTERKAWRCGRPGAVERDAGRVSHTMLSSLDLPAIAEAIRLLNRSGWSIGVAAFDYREGRVWVVSGSNGENVIRAVAFSEIETWRPAVAQARGLGMQGGSGQV